MLTPWFEYFLFGNHQDTHGGNRFQALLNRQKTPQYCENIIMKFNRNIALHNTTSIIKCVANRKGKCTIYIVFTIPPDGIIFNLI